MLLEVPRARGPAMSREQRRAMRRMRTSEIFDENADSDSLLGDGSTAIMSQDLTRPASPRSRKTSRDESRRTSRDESRDVPAVSVSVASMEKSYAALHNSLSEITGIKDEKSGKKKKGAAKGGKGGKKEGGITPRESLPSISDKSDVSAKTDKSEKHGSKKRKGKGGAQHDDEPSLFVSREQKPVGGLASMKTDFSLAKMYEELKRKVERLTKELEEKDEQLQDLIRIAGSSGNSRKSSVLESAPSMDKFSQDKIVSRLLSLS